MTYPLVSPHGLCDALEPDFIHVVIVDVIFDAKTQRAVHHLFADPDAVGSHHIGDDEGQPSGEEQ